MFFHCGCVEWSLDRWQKGCARRWLQHAGSNCFRCFGVVPVFRGGLGRSVRLGQTMPPQFLRQYWRGCKRCGRAKIGQRWSMLPLHAYCSLNVCKCCEYLVTPVVCVCARDQNWTGRANIANQAHESICTFCTIHALLFRKGRNWAVER